MKLDLDELGESKSRSKFLVFVLVPIVIAFITGIFQCAMSREKTEHARIFMIF